MSSKKRGLSIEEKRSRMLEIFYERKDFFQLKELEKIAPKEKGIIVQSVKDVVTSLVDDSLIDTDKIGTCVYFWAFPSKAIASRKRKQGEFNARLEELKMKRQQTTKALEKMKSEKNDTAERSEVLATLSQKKAEREKLLKDLQKYRDCDPAIIEKMKTDVKTALDASNRWTDNVFSMKSWCKNKFFMEDSVLNKQFSIPEELDYIE